MFGIFGLEMLTLECIFSFKDILMPAQLVFLDICKKGTFVYFGVQNAVSWFMTILFLSYLGFILGIV